MSEPTKQPWEPEEVVDAERARALIERAFPELEPRVIEAYGAGWDNTAYLVDDTWVFRFPRRTIAAPLIECEAAVLPLIAPKLPLAIPDPVYATGPSPEFRWAFAGYRLLPGETACRAVLDPRERARNAALLGEFLRALHGLETAPLRAAGLPVDELRRLDPEHRTPMIEQRLASAHERGLVERPEELRCIIGSFPVGWMPRGDKLCHGDLYARHLLVDDGHKLTGIIDWGDLHIGDPAVDLAVAAAFLPPSALSDFFDAYGPVDPETWRVARFRALLSSVMILVFGDEIGDAALVREGQTALGHLRE